jgi:hypothetical protein
LPTQFGGDCLPDSGAVLESQWTEKAKLKNGRDATPVRVDVSIPKTCRSHGREAKPVGKGIPDRPFFAYNPPNSRRKIQWLRTLRTGEPKGSPKDQKAGQQIMPTGFSHVWPI